MLRAAAAALLALLVLAAPAAAEVKTETADAGSVHAVFSYDDQGEGHFSGLHLEIYDNGTLIRDVRIPDDQYLAPGGYVDTGSLHAEDLDGDGVVEVVLDLYTGGAHCCLLSRVYRGMDAPVEHDWRDVGYTLADVGGDGRSDFVSADARFAYAFTSYAASRFPSQAFSWRDGRFVDITRTAAMRPTVRKDAAGLWRDYRKAHARFRHGRRGTFTRERIRGTLAAYAADECSLGHCGKGLRAVAAARRGHEVGRSYERGLRRLLTRLGYRR